MHEDNTVQFQDRDQILQAAQLRRSADLGFWLRQYIEARRKAQLQKGATSSKTMTAPQGISI
jgi:hypothetical protein